MNVIEERRQGRAACNEECMPLLPDYKMRRQKMDIIPDKVVKGLRDVGKPGGRAYFVRLRSKNEIQALRLRLGMTQKDFAERFGISFQTIQKWEQGQRKPEGAANAFLTVLERMPDEVIAALKADRDERVTSAH
jgi:putative transcriptional regulator